MTIDGVEWSASKNNYFADVFTMTPIITQHFCTKDLLGQFGVGPRRKMQNTIEFVTQGLNTGIPRFDAICNATPDLH